MATIYRCDKCLKQRDNAEFLVKVAVGPETYELCERCMQRLHDWLRPDPQKG